MNPWRILLTGLLLWQGLVTLQYPVLAQDATSSPVDIVAIPVGPEAIPEEGYLIEGGGFLDGAGQVARFHEVDSLEMDGLVRSYMSRLMLVADREDPASSLLADEITLVHEFVSEDAAAGAVEELMTTWDGQADIVTDQGVWPTWRWIDESADALVSLVTYDMLVVEVVSTDFQRRPDGGDHASVVEATADRMQEVLDHPSPGLANAAIALDTMKATTFFDTPDAYQQYTVQDGDLLPLLDPVESEVPDGLEMAYAAQHVVKLNTGSEIVLQLWLGTFEDAAPAEAYAGDGEAITGVRDKTPDGLRASGFTTTLVEDATVARITLLAGGDVLVSRTGVSRLADAQSACLADREQRCPAIDLADVLAATPTPGVTDAPADQVFASQQFPWRVDYGAAGWELKAVEGIEGVDYLELQSGRSLATIETVIDRHGDPPQCILEQVRLLQQFEEHAVIELGSDDPAERTAGKEPGHAWAVYTVEPLADERADQEYTIRYDCYTLLAGTASLVVSHTAPRNLWVDEAAKGASLRAGIEIDGVAAGTLMDVDAIVRNTSMMMPRIWIPRAA